VGAETAEDGPCNDLAEAGGSMKEAGRLFGGIGGLNDDGPGELCATEVANELALSRRTAHSDGSSAEEEEVDAREEVRGGGLCSSSTLPCVLANGRMFVEGSI
jgi:hypothetical protein